MNPVRVRVLPALLLSCLATCNPGLEGGGIGDNGDGGVGYDGPRRLVSVEVAPLNDVLLVDLNQEATRTFRVIGYYSDRTSEDVTARSMLASRNAAAGRLDGPTFHSAVLAGNKVEFTVIRATVSDGDVTVSGVANLTVVWLRQSGPSQDFFFSLPYLGPDDKKPLSFSTLIQSLDAFFVVDTTGSMRGEIVNLQNSLRTSIIPAVKAAAVKDAWFGIGAQEDFPVDPYGRANFHPGTGLPDDQPFILLQGMTADVTAAQNATLSLLYNNAPRGYGSDTPEGQMEALYQIATGAGNVVRGVADIPANHTGIGGVGFRKGALPVVTIITDAKFHTKGEPGRSCTYYRDTGAAITEYTDYGSPVAETTHTRAETLDALNKICAKVIGVPALLMSVPGFETDPNGICNPVDDLQQLAVGTGALVPPEAWDQPMRPANCHMGKCCTGLDGADEDPNKDGLCPLVFKIRQTGAGLGSQVVSGITQLARFASFDVVTEKSGVTTGEKGEKLPQGRTSADFIKSVLPLDAKAPPPPPTIAAPVVSGNGFAKVVPGSVVRFTVDAKNDFQPPGSEPQIFHATIKVLAGGCADLDQRDVIILVPPSNPTPG